MKLLRKIADQDGWTIQELMTSVMEEFEIGRRAENEVEKIIRFPKAKCAFIESGLTKNYGGVDLIFDRLPFGWLLMKTLAHRRRDLIDLKKRARRMLKASINSVQQRWRQSDRRKRSSRSIDIYEIRPRADKHGFDLSGDSLRYSPLWYRGSNAIMDAVRFARSCSRSRRVMIRLYDPSGNLIETLDYKSDFKEP
jgi:hypothetical protein